MPGMIQRILSFENIDRLFLRVWCEVVIRDKRTNIVLFKYCLDPKHWTCSRVASRESIISFLRVKITERKNIRRKLPTFITVFGFAMIVTK